MPTLWLDLETYSDADLKKVGAYRYAETAEILLFAYAIDDAPVCVWDCTCEPMPLDLEEMLADPNILLEAHNAGFDRTILRHQRNPALRTAGEALGRWRCTMAWALSHALPAGLSDLCTVLQVPEDKAKLAEGKKLLYLFTKPLPKNRKLRRATRETHPEAWERFKAYAANDIEAMRACAARMPRWNWNASAIEEWHCDQRINDRGFAVDRELTAAGVRAAATEKARIAARFAELTEGAVARPSLREQFRAYLGARFGLELADTQGETFRRLIAAGGLDPVAKELMQLSMAANKTSTAKYAALDPAVQDDGRYRGGLQFAGAGRTRRWAGRKFQAQNLPSRGLPDPEEIDAYIGALKAGVHDLLFTDLMRFGAAALRGVVIAGPGCKMPVADLSNIEGRMLSWVADETWKLDAFREFDAGTGPDLYNVTAVSIIGGDPWKVEKKNRNVFGKVPDLASGYQGGVTGYQTFARAYGVRMSDHWETIQRSVAPALIEQARRNFEKWGHEQLEGLEIDELEWVASETCKLAWRARHPATVKLWYAIGDAAKNAIRNPGRVFSAGRHLKMRVASVAGFRWLVVALPSGRFLTYFDPKLTDDGSITYMAEASEDGKTSRAWVRAFTHGGKMTGNVCQTLARDVLAPAMLEAERQGYLPILSVHDEILTETPDTADYSAGGLIKIMATNPPWSKGLPLAAAGFETYRYKKD